ATEIAIDLVIQLIERSDKSAQLLSPEQYAALLRQVKALPVRVRRRIRDAASAAGDLNDGIIWRGIRPVVRHVAITPHWRARIDRIAVAANGAPQPVSWEQTLADVSTLGFPRLYLLIDAVDEGAIERDALRATVAPLFDAIDQFHEQNVLLKC